jgi:hypothetical protein
MSASSSGSVSVDNAKRNIGKLQIHTSSYIKGAVYHSNKNGRLPIFAMDKVNPKNPGAKKFFSCSYSTFFSYYKKLPEKSRCFYETILPDLPSHLYIDIEGCINKNPKVNFDELFKKIMNELYEFIIMNLKLPADSTKFTIYILNSSKSTKYSKHLVIHITDVETKQCYRFKNNYHCGALMRHFHAYMLEKYGPVDQNKFYIWPSEDTKNDKLKQFFIDLGVYTKRRQFRLMGSSKFTNIDSKRRVLKLEKVQKWHNGNLEEPPMTNISRCPLLFFKQTLVQYVKFQEKFKTLICKELDGSDPGSSSLRTLEPKNGRHVSSFVTIGTKSQEKSKISKSISYAKPHAIMNELGKLFRIYYWIRDHEYVTNLKLTDDCRRIFIETNSKCCLNKQKEFRSKYVDHSKNRVYFILKLSNMELVQSCFNINYCNKVRTNLGFLNRKSPPLARMIARWVLPFERVYLGIPPRNIFNK